MLFLDFILFAFFIHKIINIYMCLTSISDSCASENKKYDMMLLLLRAHVFSSRVLLIAEIAESTRPI